MARENLIADPYNLVVVGVGGQGGILNTRIIGRMLTKKGMRVTVGDVFGGNQRGGAVVSHLRISRHGSWSPQIPNGAGHVVLGIEPAEALRVLATVGNPQIKLLVNTRAVHPSKVIAGEQSYPTTEEIRNHCVSLSGESWVLDASSEAMKLGRAIYANMIMIGALAGIDVLPLDRNVFEETLSENMPPERVEINLKAYDLGNALIDRR
ncbi:indolepyruvate ferredoxin oxidoreductase beta subunit [Desulfocicer vacuolatum DSM 3385]|uniref:Indolepyruvate ferredoxin oxidoreductase beta subunit n=1 Tax=Desulfocicer vacuolatum DSM 3385 TaxID=1121400 RepID=A0A1W2EPK5_9BACT|nr:2-oxoacid:acceptor oxidoreductase family protein [Desulfocicer vacuolatum]SMD11644.1 indolepyruvate ferredoxin oxidoreductase beta subunit [Desulfocicer vacuolatum DSM 3385]